MHYMKNFFAATLLSLLVISCGGNPEPTPRANGVSAPSATAIPGVPPPPVVGESAIVMDAATGRVLYAKNADTRRAVASTQKIITALCVLNSGDINKPVTIAASDSACEPTKLGFKPGEVYPRRDLLRVLMVKSANDVARALARDAGGTQENFAAMMNQLAARLGMRNSNFVTPNGLSAPGQYSTARDMAIAARYAYRSPFLRSVSAMKQTTFVRNNGKVVHLENTNKVLKMLPYCNGLKTGTTNQAGRCLVSTGELGGRAVIVVVLKSNTANIWKDSANLLRWALES